MTGLIKLTAVGFSLAAVVALSACQQDVAKGDGVVPTETAAVTCRRSLRR